ncbi:CaiB/BaiF CoA transferase family protein [Mumia sp. Pv 4-285]|uniref:CaiB/BaiF CoA transferase family protein n=1 Tax=Mumia qirimensis TaxID=3234852 RepID=UPI00351CE4B3
MTLPLDGVLVADFSRVLAGPLATATLADLGATVVKVERPGSGDDTRSWGPPWVGEEGDTASYFHAANRSKRSVTLDLADPGDRDLAQRLAVRADVLVENFKSGVLAKHGLGYEQVATANPGIVYCSVTGFGSTGGAELPGYDFLVQAVGGLMSITGQADADPTKVGVAVVDVLTSKDATIGILAALRARDLTGHGQHVEVNLLSSLLGSLANQASSYLLTGTAPGRMGNAHPSIAPYELLRCRDAELAVACGNDGQFQRLAEAIGAPDLSCDARFATNAARVENRPRLRVELEARLTTAPVDHWVQALTLVGVPAGKVGDLGDAIALAERLGLAPTVEVGANAPAQVRHPITYSRTPVTGYLPPPRLGQHDDEVRRWLTDPTKENLS